MSTQTSDREYKTMQAAISSVYLLLIGLLLLAVAGGEAAAAESGESRTSTTKHFADGGRDAGRSTATIRDEFAPLTRDGEREKPGIEEGTATSDEPALGRATASDFWFYDADVILFGDDDADGYFHGIDLLFDADTVWSSAAVYAVAYLSLEGGPWNEYAVTADFLVEGASSEDEYVLVTELESGYPTGDYDILIELFDADSGEFLADFGPASSSALGYLPLEDYNRDAPVVEQRVTVSHGHGGGSSGIAFLSLLGAIFWVRRHRQKHVA